MARKTGSWLSGLTAPTEDGARSPQKYQGESLGLPAEGPGSLASTVRRVIAIVIDWVASIGIATLILQFVDLRGQVSTYTLIVWFVVGVVSVASLSYTPGQALMGIAVIRVDGPGQVGFKRALARSVTMLIVVTALFTDRDGRGMHDRVTGTALVNTR